MYGTGAGKGKGASKGQPPRFHGAFTGGFSAGYFNTVGTKEGWQPATFRSSRSSRAEAREQKPEDYMDEADGLLGKQLQAHEKYDTLGSTAQEMAQRHAEKEGRGGAIPGPAPSELIAPAGDPIGKKLLRSMGWREGQGIGRRTRRRARGEQEVTVPESVLSAVGSKADDLFEDGVVTYAPKDVGGEMRIPKPKTDSFGLGYDPHQFMPGLGDEGGGAAEQGRGVYRMSDVLQWGGQEGSHGGISRTTQGFALEDDADDVYGGGTEEYDHEDVEEKIQKHKSRSMLGAFGVSGSGTGIQRCASDGRPPIQGFIVSTEEDFKQQNWPPPKPPQGFKAHHIFQGEDPEVTKAREEIWGGGRRWRHTSSLERASKLGERHFADGKGSVLDMLSSADRQKLQQAKSQSTSAGQSVIMGKFTSGTVSAFGELGRPAGLSMGAGSSGSGGGLTIVKQGGGLLAGKKGGGLPVSVPGFVVDVSADKRGPTSAPPAAAKAMPPPAAKPPEPVRTSLGWQPAALLCKRCNVPVPVVVAVAGGQDTTGMSQDDSLHLQQRMADAEKLAAAQRADDLQQQPLDIEVASKPPQELFKSIFEVSDSDSDSEESDEAEQVKEEGTVSDRPPQLPDVSAVKATKAAPEIGPESSWMDRAKAMAPAPQPQPQPQVKLEPDEREQPVDEREQLSPRKAVAAALERELLKV
ncbi:unnamed protein product [Chrysoparadoxa australica]